MHTAHIKMSPSPLDPCADECMPSRRRQRSSSPSPAKRQKLSSANNSFSSNIRRFARHGGPDLTDLRGYPYPNSIALTATMSQRTLGSGKKRSSSSSQTKSTWNSKNVRPSDRTFKQDLIDFRIFPAGYQYPDGREPPEPHNIDEIQSRLLKRRSSVSQLTTKDFRDYKRTDAHALKEQQITNRVIPLIEGESKDPSAGGFPFGNLKHLTDGTLVAGKPDFYHGAQPEQLDRKIRQHMGSLIIPSTQHDLPILPNFFLEAKGPDGTPAVALNQACYDGALGARGIGALRSLGQEDTLVKDNLAHTITATYSDGQLKIFTTHLGDCEGRQEYYMTHLRSFALTDSPEAFQAAATAFRNARDWAKEERDKAIDQANSIRNSPWVESLLNNSVATVESQEVESQDSLTRNSSFSVPVQNSSQTSINGAYISNPEAYISNPPASKRSRQEANASTITS